MTPVSASLEDGRLRLGERLTVSFQRTLRLPDVPSDRDYPLPPGLGLFPLHRASDYAARVPDTWATRGDFFFPMYRREAMWIGFDAAPWKPNVVQVGIGGVNAISGTPWSARLHSDPQDYLVVPDQPWLDGINAGDGFVRQFIAVELGEGLSVEAQVTGAETVGGIQLLAFEPRPGRFPDAPPPIEHSDLSLMMMPRIAAESSAEGGAMGLAAGGRMRQHVYPDAYGLDTWLPDAHATAAIHIVSVAQYGVITGAGPPPTPVNARSYTEHGLPWFDLYDEGAGDIAPSAILSKVRSVAEMEGGLADPGDESFQVPDEQIRRLRRGSGRSGDRGGRSGEGK